MILNLKNLLYIILSRIREMKIIKIIYKKIKINDLVKVRNFSRFKFDPYYVGINFNTVKLADPNTNLALERPVYLRNVLKYNTTSE